jgi:hypothetical protein
MKKTSTLIMVALLVTSTACSDQKSAEPVTSMVGAAYVTGGPKPGIKMPLVNGNLTFSAKGRSDRKISTDAGGSYALKIAPGDYEVRAESTMCPSVMRIIVPSALKAMRILRHSQISVTMNVYTQIPRPNRLNTRLANGDQGRDQKR